MERDTMEHVFEKNCIRLHSCGSDQVRHSLETGQGMDQEVGWLSGRWCFYFHTAGLTLKSGETCSV